MKTSAPKSILEAITALRAERAPLAEKLDAIDIALKSLSGIWPSRAPAIVHRKAKTARHTKRDAPVQRKDEQEHEDGDAAERRTALLAAISKSAMGLTLAELRNLTPKMDPIARGNALQTLKAKQQIRREGNAWVAVTA